MKRQELKMAATEHEAVYHAARCCQAALFPLPGATLAAYPTTEPYHRPNCLETIYSEKESQGCRFTSSVMVNLKRTNVTYSLGVSVVLFRAMPFSLFEWNTHSFLPITPSVLLIPAIGLALPALVAQWYRFRQPIKAGALSTNWGWIGGTASLPLAFLATYYFTPLSLVEQVMTPEGGMLLGSAFLLMAGAFGLLLFIARLIKVRSFEDETGRAQHLAATTPNVFLWSAIFSAQFAHDPSSVLGMLVMWAMLIFFVGLVIREQWLVRRMREKIAIPLGSMPYSEVTEKVASLRKVTESSSLESEVTEKIASLRKVTEPSSLLRQQSRAQIDTEEDGHLPVLFLALKHLPGQSILRPDHHNPRRLPECLS